MYTAQLHTPNQANKSVARYCFSGYGSPATTVVRKRSYVRDAAA